MSTLGGVDIGGILAAYMDSEPMKLRRWLEGGPQADINAGPNRIKKDYDFDGYPEALRSDRVKDSLIRKEMRVFGLYGSTCVVEPRVDDQVVYDNKVYQVYHVDGDSVDAVFVLYTCFTGNC